MRPIRRPLCACVFMLAATSSVLAQHAFDPKVEIYVPNGMPIQILVKRDESELTRNKYLVYRTTGRNVHKVKMFMLASHQYRRQGQGLVVWTSNDEIPVPIAWTLDQSVDRLIIVIERIETDEGVWVIDADDQYEAVGQAVDNHDALLLRAKLIKR